MVGYFNSQIDWLIYLDNDRLIDINTYRILNEYWMIDRLIKDG